MNKEFITVTRRTIVCLKAITSFVGKLRDAEADMVMFDLSLAARKPSNVDIDTPNFMGFVMCQDECLEVRGELALMADENWIADEIRLTINGRPVQSAKNSMVHGT